MNEARRGGTFATSDMDLIRKALITYTSVATDNEKTQIANLIHRIGRIKPE